MASRNWVESHCEKMKGDARMEELPLTCLRLGLFAYDHTALHGHIVQAHPLDRHNGTCVTSRLDTPTRALSIPSRASETASDVVVTLRSANPNPKLTLLCRGDPSLRRWNQTSCVDGCRKFRLWAKIVGVETLGLTFQSGFSAKVKHQ